MKTTGKLLTIGYGRKSQEEIFSLLRANKVDIVLDVRSRPYSKWNPAFNKNRLSESLPAVGIGYIWKGEELGGFKTQYDDLYTQGVLYLTELLKAAYNVVIMCSESEPQHCHRFGIADEIFKQGFEVWHIGKKGELTKHEGLLF